MSSPSPIGYAVSTSVCWTDNGDGTVSDPYLTQATFDGFQANFEAFQRKLDRQFEAVAKGFEAVSGRLDVFEQRVDARFDEVAGQLDAFAHRPLELEDLVTAEPPYVLRADVQDLKGRMDALHQRVDELEKRTGQA